MKKTGAAICVLLLAFVLFCGTAAAVSYTSDAVVKPSGDLNVGTKVSVDLTFSAIGKEISGITLSTPLDKAAWSIDIYQGKTRLAYYTPTGNSFVFPAWPFNDNIDVSVIISLTGNVPVRLSGYGDSMLKITEQNGAVYITPVQNVKGQVLVTAETPTPKPTPTSEPVSQFSYDNKAYSTTPAVLTAGKYVEGEMTIQIPKEMRTEIVLDSPLDNVHLSVVQVCSDGRHLAFLQTNGAPYTIPASTVYVDDPYNLKVTFSGTVPASLDGKDVSLLSINAGEHGSFVSPQQTIGIKQPVVTQTTVPAATTPVQTQLQTPVPTEAKPLEPKDMDLIAMLINWIKSLFAPAN